MQIKSVIPIIHRSALALILGFAFMSPAQALDDETRKDVFFSLTRTPFDVKNLPTNTTIIDSQQIERVGIQNAGQLVDLIPGVNVQKSQGLGSIHAPKIRGFLNKQMVVYIDNRRVPRDVTGGVDLSQIPAESIDKIEVVRGAGSVLYGPDAEGGVIHIFTKQAKGYLPSVKASGLWGSYGTEIYTGEVGVKKERAEGYITVSRNKTDNFQRNNTFDNTSFNGNLGYDSGLFGKTMAYFSHTQSQIGLPGGTTIQIVEWDGEKERKPRNQFSKQNDVQNSFELEHAVNLFGKVDLTGRLANTDLQRDSMTTSTGPVTSRTRINRKSVYFQADAFFGTTLGFEYYKDSIRSPFSTINESNGYGLFLQQKVNWRDLTVIGGARYDVNQDWGESLNPRLTMIYQATPWLKFSGNIAQSYQTPTFADMTDFDNNFGVIPRVGTGPSISPEYAWHYDAGFEVNIPWNIDFKATAFRADIRDKLVFGASADGMRFTTINANKAFNQGVELELSHSINTWLWHAINYSYLQSEIKGNGISPHFIETSFVPNTRVNYSMVFTGHCGVGLANTVRYQQQQFTANNRTGDKLPDFYVWDSEIFYKWKDAKVSFAVKNLTEQRYAENGGFGTYFPQAGRTYYGGVTFTFM